MKDNYLSNLRVNLINFQIKSLYEIFYINILWIYESYNINIK